MNIKTFLLLLSGLAWTVVYFDCIRIGLKQKTYAMPFWALALNITWEISHTVFDFQRLGADTQVVINGVWAVFDLVVLFTYFAYGKKYFPEIIRKKWFYPWSIAVLGISYMVQHLFIKEFGLIKGGGYAAFFQNLLMSVLFIQMLIQRNGSEGQSLTIAVSKWIGTMAPTLLFGIIGSNSMGGPNGLMLGLGILIALIDMTYMVMLWKIIQVERIGKKQPPIF